MQVGVLASETYGAPCFVQIRWYLVFNFRNTLCIYYYISLSTKAHF